MTHVYIFDFSLLSLAERREGRQRGPLGPGSTLPGTGLPTAGVPLLFLANKVFFLLKPGLYLYTGDTISRPPPHLFSPDCTNCNCLFSVFVTPGALVWETLPLLVPPPALWAPAMAKSHPEPAPPAPHLTLRHQARCWTARDPSLQARLLSALIPPTPALPHPLLPVRAPLGAQGHTLLAPASTPWPGWGFPTSPHGCSALASPGDVSGRLFLQRQVTVSVTSPHPTTFIRTNPGHRF
ncbi:hypothetical protein HJG60_008104 [Phyllostomus discolor]|uniref:Uncharacterized protein n=1 Tax=Phyllostomus discolor TaxID=89673 RepID=A0A834BI97_9CHIR|nr:hypothetical protein HJG60_008104 [Phyllostomus discolor]